MPGHKLPKGWEWKRLVDVTGTSGLFTDGDWIVSRNMAQDGTVRLLQLADIGVGSFLDESSKFITEEKFRELGCTRVKPGDILISRMADPIARACLVPELNQKAIAAVDISIVRVDPNLSDSRFVAALCNSAIVREQAEGFARGSTRKRITRRDLEDIKIPLPPLEEQRRIVARIEELTGRIEEAMRLRRAAREEAEGLMPAAMAEVFGRAEEEGWQRKRLGDLIEDFLTGFACSKKNASGEGIVHLRTNNIGINGELDLSAKVYLPPEIVDTEKYNLRSGDILFNNTNSVELVGKTALVRQDLNYAFSNHITRIRGRSSVIASKWLHFCLRMLWCNGVFAKGCRRWIGQAGYNPTMLLELEIFLPPLEEQHRIVAYLESLQAKVEQLRRLQQETQAELDAATGAILSKAFRGEL